MVWALSSKQNSVDVLQKDKRPTGVKILELKTLGFFELGGLKSYDESITHMK